MRRLKLLEDENAKLRKVVTDLSLDKEMLQDAIRRKILSLAGRASWSIRCAANGMFRSGAPAGCSISTPRPITTNPVAPGGMSQCTLVPQPCGCQGKVEDWRNYYNVERPHGAIGNQPPILLHKRDGAASPPS